MPRFARSGRWSTSLRWYAAILGTAAALLGVALGTTSGVGDLATWTIGALAAMAFVAERQPVRVSPNAEVTVSVLPMLFAGIVGGPLSAMLVGAAGVLGDLTRPYVRWIIWTASRSLSGGVASVAAAAVLASGDLSLSRLVAAVGLAVLIDALVDVCLNAVTVSLRKTGTCYDFLRSARPVLLATVPFYTTVLALLAYAYFEISAWSVLLFLPPAFAAHRFYRLYREERKATEELTTANQKLEQASLSFASALVAALDARDRYTAGHSAAVAVYSRDIAAAMGLSREKQRVAHLAGLLHDIGKVGLPAGILESSAPLTYLQRKQMESHATSGERILSNVLEYADIARIVRHHHERVDGFGYPDGLRDSEIPLISRIIGVADAYSAMTSGRPYRPAISCAIACERIAEAAGTQFDREVVAAFEEILASASEPYSAGAHADFAVEAQRHPRLAAQFSARSA